MNPNPFFIAWLSSILVLTALAFLLKGIWRGRAQKALVIVVSAFVFLSLAFALGPHSKILKARAVLEDDRAELLLRFDSATSLAQDKMMSSIGSVTQDYGPLLKQGPIAKKAGSEHQFQTEALKLLNASIEQFPHSASLKAKLAIAYGYTKRDGGRNEQALSPSQLLAKSPESNERLAGRAFTEIYSGQPVSKSNLQSYRQAIEKLVPVGWYRDVALLQLYKSAGAVTEFNQLNLQFQDKVARLFFNFAFVVVVGITCAIIGVFVIIVQLCLVARKAEQRLEDTNEIPWTLNTVYLVFLAWMATQIVAGSFTNQAAKALGLFTSGALVASLSTAAIYSLSNGPGLLYLYRFALKPNQVSFSDGVRLKTKVGTRGIYSLIFAGFLSWCAAIPIVVVAYVLASKFIAAQGSSNPVISLVLEAARSSNYLAIVCFYLTLGVLAPICEESLFRGFLYRTLRKYLGVGTALFTSAAVFSIVHLDVGAMVPLLCLGWVFGYALERTRSLIPCLVAHGMWNSVTFTLVLLLFGW